MPKEIIDVIACGHSWGIGTYKYKDENGNEEIGYGLGYRPQNPHDFFPDRECCTIEEISAHREACRIYDENNKDPKKENE